MATGILLEIFATLPPDFWKAFQACPSTIVQKMYA